MSNGSVYVGKSTRFYTQESNNGIDKSESFSGSNDMDWFGWFDIDIVAVVVVVIIVIVVGYVIVGGYILWGMICGIEMGNKQDSE